MPSFEQDHFHLLELSAIFEPQSSYHYDCTWSSFESILEQDNWDQDIDGPIPSEAINCTPENWYTQYWFNCAQNHICADLDGYEFREICDYAFGDYDESIYTGHPLDLY